MIQDHTKGQSNSIAAIQENYGGLIVEDDGDDAVLRMNSQPKSEQKFRS